MGYFVSVMRITIEPSAGDDASLYKTVVIDTRSNDEGTQEAAESALDALVTYGHHVDSVSTYAAEWAKDKNDKDI
jgi:hypothetical protein